MSKNKRAPIYLEEASRKKGEDFDEWVLRRRTISTGISITTGIPTMDFADFELGLYLSCKDPDILEFVKEYEKQMEEAMLKPDSFIKGLHSFFKRMADNIKEKKLYADFVDFFEFIIKKTRSKIKQGHASIFHSYMSLVLQQFSYLSEKPSEQYCIGITDEGELLWKKSKFPYSDCGQYELESKLFRSSNSKRKKFSANKEIQKAYGRYGYDVQNVDEIELLNETIRLYENNLYYMIPYISEDSICMLPDMPYNNVDWIEYPRIWKETEFYEQALQHRICTIPSGGIEASYSNAGDIKKIKLLEVYKDGRIVLLYRIWTPSGELSGYYDLRNGDFFSIYEDSCLKGPHQNVKNFILENYYILTCENTITRKRNYAMRQVERLQGEFHYPQQPLVVFSYRNQYKKGNKCVKTSAKIYRRDEYIMQKKSLAEYMRRLPKGQTASEEAIRAARNLGYDIPIGMTFVRPFQKHVRKKQIKET